MRAREVGGVICAEIGGAGDGGFGEEEAAFLDGRVGGFNVHHDKFDEFLNIGEGREGGAPVDRSGDVSGLERGGVEEVDGGADAVAEG